MRRLDLYLQYDRPLNAGERDRFRSLFRRRLAHEPLQYIVGETVFMGLRFAVDRRVLIPRPETEELVEEAVTLARRAGGAWKDVLDVGTGSGNIAVALAHMLPGALVTSFDVSAAALDLARQNAILNAVANVTFEEGDLFEDRPWDEPYDLVVANPPYVSAAEYASLEQEVRDFEQRIALTDDADGLRCLRRIAQSAAHCLRPGGGLCVEIAWNQGEEAAALAAGLGFRNVAVKPDVAGHPRMLTALAPHPRG